MVALDREGTLVLVVVTTMVMLNGLGLMEWLEGGLSTGLSISLESIGLVISTSSVA